MAEQFFLVWGRRLELRDTIEKALECGWWMSESDDGWFDAIEVVKVDGTTERIDRDHPTITDDFSRRESEQTKRWNEQAAARPFVGNITVDGETLESLYGDDDVESRLAKLAVLGDRVKFQRSSIHR